MNCCCAQNNEQQKESVAFNGKLPEIGAPQAIVDI
jgi:hypothetical protein